MILFLHVFLSDVYIRMWILKKKYPKRKLYQIMKRFVLFWFCFIVSANF
jgi:hypothetical protein